MEEMRLVLDKKVPPPSEYFENVPTALEELILKALEKKADNRFETAKELARVLQSTCGDLFYDQEQRAEFMSALFADKMMAVRALAESAEASDEVLEVAVERFKKSSAPRVASISAPRPRKVKASAPRAAPKPIAQPPPEPSSEFLEAPGTTNVKQAQKPIGAYLVIALLAVAMGVFVWQTMETPKDLTPIDEPPPMQALPSDSIDDEAAPLVVIDAGPQAVVAAPAPSTAVAKKGDLTLALLPEGRVVEGSKELGKGSWVTLSLSAGNHTLSIFGPDGKARTLQVRVVAGKNPSLKLNVDELPLQ